MQTRKVISYKNFPSRLPIFLTFLLYILLDKTHAPGWVWGAVGVLVLLIWIVVLIAKAHEDDIDIFAEKK